MHAEPVLDLDCGGRECVVGRRRRQHDQVDIVRRQPGIGKGGAGSRLAQGCRRLVVGRDMTLADASALGDPLVRGLDHAFEIGILHDAAGQRGTGAAHD